MKMFVLQIGACILVVSACVFSADLSSDSLRVAAEWQRQTAWRGGRFPTSEINSVALMLQNALSKNGHTNTIVLEDACGADHNEHGDATPHVAWTRESTRAMLQMLLSREKERRTQSCKSNTLYDYDLMWCMFDKSFCEKAFDHYLSMCTNYALHDDAQAVNVISTLAAAAQRHALCVSNSMYLDALMDTAEQVIADMIQTTNMRAVLVRLHTLNLMPEDAGVRGLCVPATYLIRRIERTRLLPVRAWLIMQLSAIPTREALDYCAAHGEEAYRLLEWGSWDEFLEEYRERVSMAEMRKEMYEQDGEKTPRAKVVHAEYARLTNTLAVLRADPASRQSTLRYWTTIKQIDARNMEWNAADIVYDRGTFCDFATNFDAACIADVLISEVAASVTSASSHVAYCAAALLGKYLTAREVPPLVAWVNKARPMTVLQRNANNESNAADVTRVTLFGTVVSHAVEHQRRGALEALAGQVAALRDAWVRETVQRVLQQADITAPDAARVRGRTDYYQME